MFGRGQNLIFHGHDQWGFQTFLNVASHCQVQHLRSNDWKNSQGGRYKTAPEKCCRTER